MKWKKQIIISFYRVQTDLLLILFLEQLCGAFTAPHSVVSNSPLWVCIQLHPILDFCFCTTTNNYCQVNLSENKLWDCHFELLSYLQSDYTENIHVGIIMCKDNCKQESCRIIQDYYLWIGLWSNNVMEAPWFSFWLLFFSSFWSVFLVLWF